MPSPFPGMDPFLENPSFWLDFHSRFINTWCEFLADALPSDMEASIGERVYLVENDPETRKLIYPDLSLLDNGVHEPSGGGETSGGGTTLAPVTIPVILLDGPRESYIEILYKPDHSLVAVLELLSPGNKEQPGRLDYLQKRQALLYQHVHLVELDLLMGGQRLPMRGSLPAGDYYYFVHRTQQRPDCQVYTWNLRQPLTKLPVPLRPPYADIVFDLAAVFTTAYERGRFGRRIPYRGDCPAALKAQDRSWVEEMVGDHPRKRKGE